MEKIKWTYQQYDPETRSFFPVPEDGGEATVMGVPDGYEKPIMEMFRKRDERQSRCRIVAFQ